MAGERRLHDHKNIVERSLLLAEERLIRLHLSNIDRCLMALRKHGATKATAGEQKEFFLTPDRPITQVPRLAEQTACLLVSRPEADATLGDLEEKYRQYADRYSPRYATFWYWWQVGSLVAPRLRNVLLWLGGLAGLRKMLDWIGKLGGS
jgi:hypothetical protein